MSVYCLAEDAKGVKESFDEFFGNHDFALWRPRSARVDRGLPHEARRASRWHGEW